MFTRRELALLRAMYRHGTVTAAAASIHLGQPAASALLAALEVRLGFALFSRERRRLQLTAQGRSLMPEVINALSAIEAADRRSADIRQGATHRLTLGAVAVVAAVLLPRALASVRAAHPRLALTLRAGTALELIGMAAEHRIDLGIAIVSNAAPDPRVVSQRLARLGLHAVLRPDHPAAGRRSRWSLAALSGQDLIVLAPALPAGLATQHALEAAGLAALPLIEVSQSFAACELAAQGLGVAIVESLGAVYARERGLVTRPLLKLDDSELALVHPRDKPIEGAAGELRRALIDAVEAMGLEG